MFEARKRITSCDSLERNSSRCATSSSRSSQPLTALTVNGVRDPVRALYPPKMLPGPSSEYSFCSRHNGSSSITRLPEITRNHVSGVELGPDRLGERAIGLNKPDFVEVVAAAVTCTSRSLVIPCA